MCRCAIRPERPAGVVAASGNSVLTEAAVEALLAEAAVEALLAEAAVEVEAAVAVEAAVQAGHSPACQCPVHQPRAFAFPWIAPVHTA